MTMILLRADNDLVVTMTLRFLRRGALLGLAAAVLTSGSASYADDAHKGLYRPLELGVSGSSIEHIIDGPFAYCYVGTLGSLLTDGTDNYILSNNHVLAKENDPDNLLAPDGYEIIQPGLLDEGSCSLSLGEPANRVAYLTDYVEILFGKGKSPPPNWIDAAFAVTTVASDGSIRDVGSLTTGSPAVASVGHKVQKSGRTTGHTFGEVVATNVTIKVKYNGGTALFLDQIEVVGLCDTNFSSGGDSGSLIATLPDGTGPRAALGLLFAGGGASTFANPIGTVLTDLGAQAGLSLSMVNNGRGNVDDASGPNVPSCEGGGDSLVAAGDSYKLPKKETVLTVADPGVLGNDTGFVGSPSVAMEPVHGTVNLGGDGGFTYSYNGSDRNGDKSDSFDYEITDGAGGFATATVAINLTSKGGGRPSGAGLGSSGREHALQVRADHENELFDIPGVLGTGIGADASGNPVIRVYVASAARSVDHPIPPALEGLPVQVVVTGTIEAY